MWSLAVAAGVLAAVWLRWRLSKMSWGDFVIVHGARVYSSLWHRWSGRRAFRDWPDGPALIIANHTCSADPTFILAGWQRPVSFVVAREHYKVHPLTHMILEQLHCVAATRNGQDYIALRGAWERLKRGLTVCLFPEGNLSGVARGRILTPKQGIGYLALRTRAPVYPAYIAGGPRTERLLESWVWPAHKAVRIYFGPPADLAAFYGRPITRQLIREVTIFLMGEVEVLNPLHARGVTKDHLSTSSLSP